MNAICFSSDRGEAEINAELPKIDQVNFNTDIAVKIRSSALVLQFTDNYMLIFCNLNAF